MILLSDPVVHMWFILAILAIAVISFVYEKFSVEVTSVAVLTALLLFGQIFPLYDANGENLLSSAPLLSGFANPALIAVLALLVMGQAMIHTDSLRFVTSFFTLISDKYVWLAILGIFVFVMLLSAFLNNTPLVVIAIPLVQALVNIAGYSESRVMMPLSFVAILGGMTTIVGSSTNLLVSSAMVELGYEALGFFDFFLPGMILAGIGFLYVIFILPLLLPDRISMSTELVGDKKEFVAELDIVPDSKLIGAECVEGKFAELGDVKVKLIQRGGHLILPPFEGYQVQAGDVLIAAATRDALVHILSKYPGFLLSKEESAVLATAADLSYESEVEPASREGESETRVLAEIMVTPASRMVDMGIEHINFQRRFGLITLGIERRAKVVRRRIGRIHLEAGDVLLVAGRQSSINALRENPDFIVLSGSKRDFPVPQKAPLAIVIFLTTITLAATGLISIPVAAVTGAVSMIATGCLNLRQATRAVDRKIFLLVGSMIALGTALQATGGAGYLAERIVNIPFIDSPLEVLAVLFLIIAFFTNVLSNNACAILFTPIALNLAGNMTVGPDVPYDIAFIFAVSVVFAANCSFASPIGYQTNLLVMGPGHYKFRDFIKGGVPLMLIIWISFILIGKYYYGLN